MAEKKSPTIEIDESNDSDQDIAKIIDELSTDAQKHLAENVESILEGIGPVNDSSDPDMLMKNLQSFYDDMNKAEKRALSDEENFTTNQKRRKIDYFNIEDGPFQVVGGTKNKKNLSSKAYDSLTPDKNSSMVQDPFTPKHVATCSSTEEPSTSHTLSAQLPPPPTTPSSSQPSFNPKHVQTCPVPEQPSTSSFSSTQPPQPPVSASTSQETPSVSSLR